MGKKELKGRENWQDVSGEKAKIVELDFHEVFKREFTGSSFEIVGCPNEFSNIYNSVKLKSETLKAIYSPDETWKHGVFPDYAIRNNTTGKTLYVEVKRQDGWVEGKPRNAGRGNAHERSCKFFTPGLLKKLRREGKIEDEDSLPFWVVFQGDIARDPKRVREITFWYDRFPAHFFLWHNSTDMESIVSHFNEKLRHLLE